MTHSFMRGRDMLGLTTKKHAERMAKNRVKNMRDNVSQLLWAIVNQREKVNGILNDLLPTIYPNYPVEARREIKRKILERIGLN